MFNFFNKFLNGFVFFPRSSALSLRLSALSERKRVYLDNAGATPISVLAERALIESLKIFGNPSAIYEEGVDAKNLLTKTKEEIGKIINARLHEIYFTGTGTESCNLAIMGTYLQWKKENEHATQLPHIIISSIEHPAVMEVVNYLAINSLANVTYLPVYENGIIKLNDVREAINENTILISVMCANNEIGTVQPIKEIGRLLRELRRGVIPAKAGIQKDLDSRFRGNDIEGGNNYPIFHTDACQAGNYLNLDVFRLGVDMMTLNSGKVYGPKGIALLYKKEDVKISPMILGGGQERNLRSGTENVASAYAFAVALKESQEIKEKESARLLEIRNYFVNELKSRMPSVKFYGDFENRLPNNINCSIPNIPSDEMIIRLSHKGFSVSHKSACASQVGDASYVIKALGASDKEAKENIRITTGRYTSKKDMENLVESIVEISRKFAKSSK